MRLRQPWAIWVRNRRSLDSAGGWRVIWRLDPDYQIGMRETIILDLLTGDPQGLRIAKFMQSWTSQAFAAPRTELKDLLAKSEMDSPGIYILHGEARDASSDSLT